MKVEITNNETKSTDTGTYDTCIFSSERLKVNSHKYTFKFFSNTPR